MVDVLKTGLWFPEFVGRKHGNPRSYARRSMFLKRDNFLQLISTLFCEVKRGFVDP
jgi:hypothetical protein